MTQVTAHPEARLVVVVSLAVAAGWLGLERYRSHSRAERGVVSAPQPAGGESTSWHFRNGRWVKLDAEQMQQVARDMARRTPGLVRVAGTVGDGAHGSGLPGAVVVFAGPSGETTVTAGPDGRYSREIQPGFYRVFARLDGYLTVVTGVEAPERTDPGAADGRSDRLIPPIGLFRDQYGVDLDLRPSARITGSLFDQEGAPVAGAVVVARGARGVTVARPALGTEVAVVGLDGHFSLEVVPGPISLTASHPDYGGLAFSPDNQLTVEPGERRSVALTMARGCVISGRVTDGDGVAVGEGTLQRFVGGLPPGDFVAVGSIDARGRFRFATADRQKVRLRGWPWSSPPTAPAEFDCARAARYDGVDLVVADEEPDLAGNLVSVDGQPVEGATIDLVGVGASGVVRRSRADQSGHWAFYDLPPGRYQLASYVEGQGALTAQLDAPSRGHRLALSGTGVLMGTVQGMREGAFTLHVDRCRLPGDDHHELSEVSMASAALVVQVERGEFRVDGVPACPIEARAETPYRTVRFVATIAVGDSTVHAIDLRQPIAKQVRGVVLEPDRAPAAGVSVLRVPESGAPRSSGDFAISDAKGHFRLRAYSGDRLLFSDSGGVQTSVRIPWTSGGEEQLDVRLPPSS